MLRFTDGVSINTQGELRPLRLHDGWYIVGQGMCCPVDSLDEAKVMIAEVRAPRKGGANGNR